MFSNGHSIKVKNHSKAGATNKRKLILRLRAMRRPNIALERTFSLRTDISEAVIGSSMELGHGEIIPHAPVQEK
jgi:hypothetical protein